MDNNKYKLSPSDFKYLWEECKTCYHRKVMSGQLRPSVPFPSIFNKMQGALQNNLIGRRTEDVCPEIGKGVFIGTEGWVASLPLPGSQKFFIKGKFDLLVKFDDGTHGVIDAKMVNPNDPGLGKFSRQLHAYKYAFEKPEKNDPKVISKMGLLIVDPQEISLDRNNAFYKINASFREIPIDMDDFFNFTGEVERVLLENCPASQSNCNWCMYSKYSVQ